MGTHVREVFRFINRHTNLSDEEQRTAEYAIVEGVLGTLDPHTLLMLRAGTFMGMPAATAAWRAGIWPAPAVRTCPMMT